jgi:hypothetical protein
LTIKQLYFIITSIFNKKPLKYKYAPKSIKQELFMIYKNYFIMGMSAFFMVLSVPVSASHPTDEEHEEPVINLPAYLNADRASQASTSTHLPDLRDKAEDEEDRGNVFAAVKTMDRLLKISNSPALEDLCYALNLNYNIPRKDRQIRANKIAEQISQVLKVNPTARCLTLKTASWAQFQPYLEYLIDQTIADSSYDKREFRYNVMGKDFQKYIEWQNACIAYHKYPIGIEGRSNGSKGEKSPEGFSDIYFMQLGTTNYSKKEIEDRRLPNYSFFEDKLDPFRINHHILYNLIVRAGFTEEDFTKGQYVFQDKIRIKPVRLQNTTLPACSIELKNVISSALKRIDHPYVVFVFELLFQACFILDELRNYDQYALNYYFFNEFGYPKTIIEPKEKRLYYCIYNEKRRTLDLQSVSAEEAFKKVRGFSQERYDHFEIDFKVIIGESTHVNVNESRGILHDNLMAWTQKPALRRFIDSVHSAGEGRYIVKLHPPKKLVLEGNCVGLHTANIISAVLEIDLASQNRLLITHPQKQSPIDLKSCVFKAVINLFQEYGFTGTFQPKAITDNALHLTWDKIGGNVKAQAKLELQKSNLTKASSSSSSQPKKIPKRVQHAGQTRNPKTPHKVSFVYLG